MTNATTTETSPAFAIHNVLCLDSYKRTDDRPNRNYRARMVGDSFMVVSEDARDAYRYELAQPERRELEAALVVELKATLYAAFGESLAMPQMMRETSSCHDIGQALAGVKSGDRAEPVVRLRAFAFNLRADKPSLILTEDQIVEHPVWIEVRCLLGRFVGKLNAWAEKAVATKDTLDDANELLTEMRKSAVESARLACRFNQRLAALRAEVEAEARVQAEQLLRDFPSDGTAAEAWEVSPSAFRLVASRLAKDAAAAAMPAGRRGSPHYASFTVEDLDNAEIAVAAEEAAA